MKKLNNKGKIGKYVNIITDNIKKKNKIIPLIIFIALAIIILAIAIFNFLSPSIEQIKDSVVMIEVYDENNEVISIGSGFCAYENDYIVTNFHVIEGASAIKVITDDNEEYKVEDIVIFNKKEDLAILSIDGNLKPIKLGNGNKVKTKNKVTTIGSPMGEKNTVSEGIVSNSDEKDVIRITAPISHGSSGGVLLNNKNKVIGITSAGYDDAQNLNFAINVNVLNKLYNDYIENKYAKLSEVNYEECIPNFMYFDEKLEIQDTCDFSNYKNYSTDSLNSFYLATNSFSIFDTVLTKTNNQSMNVNYKKFSISQKKKALEYYTVLINSGYCDSISSDECDIDNVMSWTPEQYIMQLDVMFTYSLSVFLVEVEDYSHKKVFKYVNSLPYDIPEKAILLLLYGGYDPSDLADSDANSVVEYINEFELTIDEKGKLLEYLGYSVNGVNVEW